MKGDKASDKLLIVADIAEKALNEIQDFIVRLTAGRLGEERARELARILTEGRWTHDYPITLRRQRS